MASRITLIDNPQDLQNLFSDRKIRLFRIGERRVAVTCVDGKFYAFDNHCPHSSYPLNEGVINYNTQVVCPWHNYMFDLVTGLESSGRCSKLNQFEIELVENQLILEIS